MPSLALIALAERLEYERRMKLSPEELAEVETEDEARERLKGKLLVLTIIVTIAAAYLHPAIAFLCFFLGVFNSTCAPMSIRNDKKRVDWWIYIKSTAKDNIAFSAILIIILLSLYITKFDKRDCAQANRVEAATDHLETTEFEEKP